MQAHINRGQKEPFDYSIATLPRYIRPMLSAAGEGGKQARQSFRETNKVHIKPDGSPQLNADIKTQKVVLDRLQSFYPQRDDISYMGEEDAGHVDDSKSQVRFVVDPIDGTANFSQNNENWGVVITAQERDEHGKWQTIAGVVHSPERSETIWASNKEEQSHLIKFGKTYPVDVTQTGDKIHALPVRPAVAVKAFGVPAKLYDAMQSTVYEHGMAMRESGSTALDLAQVAGEGLQGIVCVGKLNAWDIEGPKFIAEKSGCVIQHKTVRVTEQKKSGAYVKKDMPILVIAKTQITADALMLATREALGVDMKGRARDFRARAVANDSRNNAPTLGWGR